MADGKVTIKAIFDGKQAEGEVSKLKSVLNGLGNTGNKIGSVFKSVLGANLSVRLLQVCMNYMAN